MNKNWILLIAVFQTFAQTHFRNLSNEKWVFSNAKETQKYKTKIPSTIHSDLFKNKLIENPFFGTNEKKLQWIENETWVYECDFFISKQEFQNQNINLNFEGLDTYATIYLNEKKIAQTQNMFRTWNFSIKKSIKTGKNHLKIIFEPAVTYGK